ncbi:MAG: pyridoxal-phosphate dependent enzyme [Melioribacteraceae bacterium]|nr:pyridoxal-phosphate dependent enzyme [Melioribacteraceae bacterium]
MIAEGNIKTIDIDKSVLQRIILPNNNSEVTVYLKRDDLIHLEISGNKWRKLKYNLLEAKKNGYGRLLTFGGAFSNHIYAVAAAGKIFEFKTIGIIRGEEHLPLNPTLKFAVESGMELHYLKRSIYRNRNDKNFQAEIAEQFGNVYIIPEGGTNDLALDGVAEIIDELYVDFDYIFTPVGSGGTLAGLVYGLNGKKNVVGISSLKNGNYLNQIVGDLLKKKLPVAPDNWRIICDYSFGGFAKIKPILVEFVERFYSLNAIELDYIYTGKMLFAVDDMIRNNYFSKGSNVVALHTGGLQGNAGMQSKIKKLTIENYYD